MHVLLTASPYGGHWEHKLIVKALFNKTVRFFLLQLGAWEMAHVQLPRSVPNTWANTLAAGKHPFAALTQAGTTQAQVLSRESQHGCAFKVAAACIKSLKRGGHLQRLNPLPQPLWVFGNSGGCKSVRGHAATVISSCATDESALHLNNWLLYRCVGAGFCF